MGQVVALLNMIVAPIIAPSWRFYYFHTVWIGFIKWATRDPLFKMDSLALVIGWLVAKLFSNKFHYHGLLEVFLFGVNVGAIIMIWSIGCCISQEKGDKFCVVGLFYCLGYFLAFFTHSVIYVLIFLAYWHVTLIVYTIVYFAFEKSAAGFWRIAYLVPTPLAQVAIKVADGISQVQHWIFDDISFLLVVTWSLLRILALFTVYRVYY